MSGWIHLCNSGAVSVFGSVLSAAFAGAWTTRRKKQIFSVCMLLILLWQWFAYTVLDIVLLRQIYPLLMHAPLFFLLYFLTGKQLWSCISILSAYLCCQLRRWIALFVTAMLSGGAMMQDTAELVITFPLLWGSIRFIAPVFRQLAAYPIRRQWQFGVIPVVYYGFDYLTRIYTELLPSGNPVAVEFMPSVCCLAYLVFLLYNSIEEQKYQQLYQRENCLSLQLTQAVREIDLLRESQTLAKQYRHDLRHHLQYLSFCMENGQNDQAQKYIADICRKMDAQRVRQYCENEAANLIFSAFAGRAEKDKIPMKIHGMLPAKIHVSDSDLCVLLSNALENAIHACQPLAENGVDCGIDIQFYQRGEHVFLQILNTCLQDVLFEQGIPVSRHPGHGIGVQSICAIVEQYGGHYVFLVQDGQFILRLSL